MRTRYVSLLVIVLLLLLSFAACASDTARATARSSTTPPPGTATATAKTAACHGLATVNKVFASLSGINASTTVGDVKTAQRKATNTLNAIASRIPASDGQLLSQLRSANAQLTAKIAGYPDDTPIGQTSVKVQDLKARVATAQNKTSTLASKLNCAP